MRNREFQPARHSKCPANETQRQSSQWETWNFSLWDTETVQPMRNSHSLANEKQGISAYETQWLPSQWYTATVLPMRNREFQPMRHSDCPANETQPQSSQWEIATDDLIRNSHRSPANEKEGNSSQWDMVNVPPLRNIHSSVQLLSVADSLWPHGAQHTRPPCPSPTLRACSKLMSIQSVMPSNHFILCCHLLPPSIFPSNRVFSNESVLRSSWPKYWSFSFSISPFNEHSGLISFRMDWLDLFAVQGTLKSLLQHHSAKA